MPLNIVPCAINAPCLHALNSLEQANTLREGDTKHPKPPLEDPVFRVMSIQQNLSAANKAWADIPLDVGWIFTDYKRSLDVEHPCRCWISGT